MRPSFDEIQRAAYDRWERQGWHHGGDRDDWLAAETEVTFRANYRTIAEYPLDGTRQMVLGEGPGRRCRFCERNPSQVGFSDPRPIVPDRVLLLTAEVCDDCRVDWFDALDGGFRLFWEGLDSQGRWWHDAYRDREPSPLSVAALKSLVASALLVMPARELAYFGDALEWVSNPDHDCDDRLLHGGDCLVYRASFLGPGAARISLSRRFDDDAPVPYMIGFLACDGMMVQVPLPMCVRDEDLDGQTIQQPRRVLWSGWGRDFSEAHAVPLPLGISRRRAHPSWRRSSIAP